MAPVPATGAFVWRADLDADAWPGPERLPAGERERAARMLRPLSRQRWVAARWALRSVLGECLGGDPATIELLVARRGKPRLADPDARLRFNLSHSGGLALVAVAWAREVGVDVERIVPDRHPPSFYAAWTRHEALVKCHGVGLVAPLPADADADVTDLDVEPGFAAALALSDRPTPAPPLPPAGARDGRWRQLGSAATSSSWPAPLR
jgi:4'-phosphopantetheinyl transferase